jgi:hypothetical protein
MSYRPTATEVADHALDTLIANLEFGGKDPAVARRVVVSAATLDADEHPLLPWHFASVTFPLPRHITDLTVEEVWNDYLHFAVLALSSRVRTKALAHHGRVQFAALPPIPNSDSRVVERDGVSLRAWQFYDIGRLQLELTVEVRYAAVGAIS